MTSINPFEMTDLLNLQSVNLDYLTENFPIEFYMEYLILWPNLFFKNIETLHYGKDKVKDNKFVSGYIMGKTEGKKLEWHSHITAVTVSKMYRRISLASSYLCVPFKLISDSIPKVEFIDLFVKCNNVLALKMYENMHYSVYRRVVGYYGNDRSKSSDENDAFDMRLSMPRNNNKSVRKDGRNHRCRPEDVRF